LYLRNINYFMKIKIHSKHIDLGPTQEALIHQKFEKITRLAHRLTDESTEIRVDVEHEESKKQEDSYLCKLTLFVPGDTLRAESRGNTLEDSVDAVVEKIKGPIARYKEKTQRISDHK